MAVLQGRGGWCGVDRGGRKEIRLTWNYFGVNSVMLSTGDTTTADGEVEELSAPTCRRFGHCGAKALPFNSL